MLLKNVLQDVLPSITRYNAQMEIVLFGVLFIVLLQKARGGVVPMIRRFLPRERGGMQSLDQERVLENLLDDQRAARIVCW